MSDCCDPAPYRRFFDTKQAERDLRAYRRRGLDPMAASLVEHLDTDDLAGLTVLEVGGGIGAIQIELLRRGAASATNVELSSEYEQVAEKLAEEEGLSNRISRNIGDFVEGQLGYERADIVVMNRVVCCYPWMERLVGAASTKAGKYLALAFPRDKWWVKTGVAIGNALMGFSDGYVKGFVHPVPGIEATATESGLTPIFIDHDLIWQAMVLAR
ncbi:MAG: methyltransferase domain-containing protein [Acidimicrobiia bacterium]